MLGDLVPSKEKKRAQKSLNKVLKQQSPTGCTYESCFFHTQQSPCMAEKVAIEAQHCSIMCNLASLALCT